MSDAARNASPHLLALDVPVWLMRAVAPLRIHAAAVWHSGVMLDLHSERDRFPVLIHWPTSGPLSIAPLAEHIPTKNAAAFIRALGTRLLRAAELFEWLRRLRQIASHVGTLAPQSDTNTELSALVEIWRVWPILGAKESNDVPRLPQAIAIGSPYRAPRAALTLLRFARGEILEAIADWSSLPPTNAPAFMDLHLDSIALGILGRRDEALRALRHAEKLANDVDCWVVIARAYETLDACELAIAAHEQVVALRGNEWDRLRLARARGDFAPGEALLQPKPEDDAEARITFARNLIQILEAAGRYDDLLATLCECLEPLGAQAPIDLVVRVAELYLWRRQTAQARSWIAAAHDDARARLVLAAADIIDGNSEAGLRILDEIPSDCAPCPERLLWQAEAHLALGRNEEALECVNHHILIENSLVAYLLKLLVLLRIEPTKTLAQAFSSRTFLDALALDVLPTLRSMQQINEARVDASRFDALIRGILDDMGGNRGSTPTWCRRNADGQPRLERVDVRLSARDAAVANLITLRTKTPDEVLAGFDVLSKEYPNSPYPCTYLGELLIWLGRYDAAIDSFAEADHRAPTRWSYIGRAAAYDLLGDAKLADEWTLRGAQNFAELETATTHVYRGERHRKLGHWEAARRDLEIALSRKTRRIGARVNLALTYRAMGEAQSLEQQIDRLKVDAPAFLWEAGVCPNRPIDDTTLVAMLDRMVGNRSSFLHTMVDADGRFRVIPEPNRYITHARLSLPLVRDELERAIARC